MTLASLPLQHVLFFLPYLQIARTGGFLSEPLLYLAGFMGNQYVKVYCILSDLVYMLLAAIFLLYGLLSSTSSVSQVMWHFRLPQLLIMPSNNVVLAPIHW